MERVDDAAVGRATSAKVTLRLAPFVFLPYAVAFSDEVEEVVSPVAAPGAPDTQTSN